VLFWVLAPDPVAVGAVLAVVAVWNVFRHSRLALPRNALAPIERLLVTPDVHRIHHALPAHLHDRNFGTVLTLWNRLFGWYRAPDGEPFDTGIAGWKAEDDLVAYFIAPLQPLTEEPAGVARPANGDRPAR
jgi:sterol desaturase/sphingolipid hydroxylase (fatty acid hydroxylase superfamily)